MKKMYRYDFYNRSLETHYIGSHCAPGTTDIKGLYRCDHGYNNRYGYATKAEATKEMIKRVNEEMKKLKTFLAKLKKVKV